MKTDKSVVIEQLLNLVDGPLRIRYQEINLRQGVGDLRRLNERCKASSRRIGQSLILLIAIFVIVATAGLAMLVSLTVCGSAEAPSLTPLVFAGLFVASGLILFVFASRYANMIREALAMEHELTKFQETFRFFGGYCLSEQFIINRLVWIAGIILAQQERYDELRLNKSRLRSQLREVDHLLDESEALLGVTREMAKRFGVEISNEDLFARAKRSP